MNPAISEATPPLTAPGGGADALLAECEAFIAKWQISTSQLGVWAIGDKKLVFRLREGKDVVTNTETRVRAFITGFETCASRYGITASSPQARPARKADE